MKGSIAFWLNKRTLAASCRHAGNMTVMTLVVTILITLLCYITSSTVLVHSLTKAAVRVQDWIFVPQAYLYLCTTGLLTYTVFHNFVSVKTPVIHNKQVNISGSSNFKESNPPDGKVYSLPLPSVPMSCVCNTQIQFRIQNALSK